MKNASFALASALLSFCACTPQTAPERAKAPSEIPSTTTAVPRTSATLTAPSEAATAPAVVTAPKAASSSADVPAPSPSATDPKAVSALGFRTVQNIEMVPYCLPYPSTYLSADTSERWEHGRKVFTRKSTKKGAPASRMDLQGVCGPRSLAQLYEDDRKQIASEVPKEAITVSTLRGSSYALSWSKGDRIFYGKMWAAKNDPGCFVKATFEYDTSERATFDTIISHVASADPECP